MLLSSSSTWVYIKYIHDHGARILGDYSETYYPGYTLYGRLKNLAEIRA